MIPGIAVGVVEEEVPEEGAFDKDFAVVGVASTQIISTSFLRRTSLFAWGVRYLLVDQNRPGRKWIIERIVGFVQEAYIGVAAAEGIALGHFVYKTV